jgi:hypothetical protein
VTRVWVKLPDHIRHLPIVCPEDCIHISTAKKKPRKSASPQAQQRKSVPLAGGARAPQILSWKETLAFRVSQSLSDSADAESNSFRANQSGSDSAEERESGRARSRKAFAAADADGSGHLDFDEFARMDINNGLSMAAKRRVFDSLDVDRSGKLVMQEFAMYTAAVKIQARHRGGRDRCCFMGSVLRGGLECILMLQTDERSSLRPYFALNFPVRLGFSVFSVVVGLCFIQPLGRNMQTCRMHSRATMYIHRQRVKELRVRRREENHEQVHSA